MKPIFLGLLAILCSIAFAQTKEVKPTTGLCSKASGISKGFQEYVASKMRVPMASVAFVRASAGLYGNDTCSVTVDTAKGPQSCTGLTLYTDGRGDYWVGGSCF